MLLAEKIPEIFPIYFYLCYHQVMGIMNTNRIQYYNHYVHIYLNQHF